MGFHRTCFTTAILFCLTLTVVQCSGELFLLRDIERKSPSKLTCVSEDDDSALIWNYNPINNDLNRGNDIFTNFMPQKLSRKNNPKCAIWEADRCIAKWEDQYGWNVVNSRDKPMGPVLDFRWEGFPELVGNVALKDQKYQYVEELRDYPTSIVFSARGAKDVHVFLCENRNPATKRQFCFWIILGGWNGRKSVIRTCRNGASVDKTAPKKGDCVDVAWTEHEIGDVVHNYEWRTFTLKFINEDKTIEVFKDTDYNDRPFLHAKLETWGYGYHLSMRYERYTRIRFHFYEYLREEYSNTIKFSEEFHLDDENFCLELLVGLCPQCELIVDLVDKAYNHKFDVGSIVGMENDTNNGLLTWRFVKLYKNLEYSRPGSVRLKIQTFSTGGRGSHQWAIDHFRICKPVGQTRQSSILADRRGFPSTWHEIRCQKLSYSNSVTIDSLSTHSISTPTHLLQEYVKNLVKLCGSPCTSLGKYWSICYRSGCTCDRGFMGNDCSEECNNGHYGYNCDAECEFCDTGFCDKLDGLCGRSYESSTSVQPFISKDIEKPKLENITDTTATVYQKIYRAAEILDVRIVIHNGPGTLDKYFKMNLRHPEIPRTYVANLSGLTAGTDYSIHAIVRTNLGTVIESIEGPEIHFLTTCYGNPHFIWTHNETSVTIDVKDTTFCLQGEEPIYFVNVYDLVNNVTQKEHLNPAFPCTYGDLTADTAYAVTILNIRVNSTVFYGTFRTPVSAPSSVEKLNVKSVTATEVELQWDPPKKTNGAIRSYTVLLEVVELLGCKYLDKLSPRQNKTLETVNTRAHFTGLYPYANYEATVIAKNTKSGEPEITHFQTREIRYPTSNVSNLRLGDKNASLRWNVPTDCTTITGPTKAVKLIFTNVDDSVSTLTYVRPFSNREFDLKIPYLMHYAWYRVRVYVIRDKGLPESSMNYQELTWRTPPAAPTAVQNLQIYDVDPDTAISLRWEPPNPANGEIDSYKILIYKKRKLLTTETLKVPEKEPSCRLWKNYVCFENLSIPPHSEENGCTIEVYAFNKEVTQAGDVNNVSITSKIYTEPPSKPENLTSISKGCGVISLTWAHPSITPTKITRFYIRAHFINTTLQTHKMNGSTITEEYPIDQYHKVYSFDLKLSTSTLYDVYLVASNKRNSNSTQSGIQISVPSGVSFASEEKIRVTQSGSFIEIETPKVVNATRQTTVEITVKEYGSYTRDRLGASSSTVIVRKWTADEYEERNRNFEYLTIEIKECQNNDSAGFLYFGRTYLVMAVVKDSFDSSANRTSSPITLIRDEPNLAWLIIFPIIAICLLLLFFGHRKFSRPREKSLNVETSMPPWNQLKSPTPSPEMKSNQLSTEQNTPEVVPYNPFSCTVKIADFEEYVKDAVERGLLTSQCEKFERGLKKACEHGKLPDNKSKNRYRDLITYDESRVVLEQIPDNPYSDYINASYIPGYRKERAYIATQGPLPSTVKDFWRMIWQEEVRVICMLANVVEGGRKKCEQYWPNIGTETEYGDIIVSNPDHEVFVDYTVRTLIVSLGIESRTVTHLHYTGWPDHGVPLHIQSLVPYLKRLQKLEIGNGPLVVHCSAGVGRTGTIILCDTCLRRAEEEKVIDLPAVTVRMRECRANMVDNAQQYLLAHLLILEYTISDQTEIPCDNILKSEIKRLRKQLPSHMRRLNETVWQDQALHNIAAPRSLILEKGTTNGVSELPLVSLSSESSALFDAESKYIRTIGVDGVKMKNQYLASRLPSPANHADLWRIIDEENIELIIILQSPDLTDSTYCKVIPSESSLVGTGDTEEDPNDDEKYFTIDRLVLSGDEEKSQPLTVLTCTGWQSGSTEEPPPASALVSLWIASEKISRQENPTLVLCRDGVTGCGLYVALSFLLERMAVERVCDVISAVRAVRKFKPEFVQSLAQFEYLYDAAVKYDKCFQTYANFS